MRAGGLALAFGLCVALAMVAQAQVIWPAGWAIHEQDGAVVAQSPATAGGSAVFLIAPMAERITSQPLAAWFEMKVRAAASNGTTIGKRFGTKVEQGTLYQDGYELRQNGKLFAYAFAFAYETPALRQFALILRSADVDKGDPRVITAEDTIADGWKGRLPLGKPGQVVTSQGGNHAPPSVPAPATPAKPSAGNCHEEMMPITTWTMQQVCYPSAGGMSNCHLESVPVQQRVLQTVCR